MSDEVFFEINDIDMIPQDTINTEVEQLSQPVLVPFLDRKEAFVNEWMAFLKKEITNNFEPWFHLWRGMVANRLFLNKMEKLANKYFRGVLNGESLTRFFIYVKHLNYSITAFLKATRETKETKLESILKFVESFSEESFEELECWNSILTNSNMNKLKPYRPEDFIEEPEFDKEKNAGYPYWIRFSECDENCSCGDNDSGDDSDDENKSQSTTEPTTNT
jgi:hypothetical protein